MSIFCYKNINTSQHLGWELTNARNEQNLTIEEVAVKTRLPLKYLQALENSRFFELPPSHSHRRAYLKQLCELYNLNFKTALYKFRCEGGFKNLSSVHPYKISTDRMQPFIILFRNLSLVGFILFFIIYLSVQIYGIVTPPKLLVFSPMEGAISNQAEITIQGQTDRESNLRVNGQEIKVDEQGKFNDIILLSTGVNTITLSTTKKHGKTTTVVRHVVVTAKPAKVSINQDLGNVSR
ncbi:MAG: hypothetical protein ACD_72C00548G0003 [uncultured bacterium]|nr:MAG: hypothetical protein ACD_72C00548G0003 [uncultured bacterium]